MSKARVTFETHSPIGSVDRRLFGSFVEHLGRSVYDGLYEPQHPEAGADGFRADVKELVKELGITTVRYPGGNFVSGFRWEDSVGPPEARPTRLDLAWHSTETNAVGLHEFADWLQSVGSELMLAINLGTRGVSEALDLLEYCNVAGGTTLSNQRISNGQIEPFNVRMWCLGNEMDGPWQLGHRSADDYGKLAAQTARAMRMLDPGLELVACGSSSRSMPTFGEWERVVLHHTYDSIDFISCHAYYEERDGDLLSFLASATDMDAFIDSVVATIDHVKDLKRSARTVNISFDEWNVWYQTRFEKEEVIRGIDNWPQSPRILEDTYSAADAVVVGNLLISLLRHADRVRSASLAQLVNVIAPIMTEPGGSVWRQSIFYPFALTSRFARGNVLRTHIESDSHQTAAYGLVRSIDAVTTHDPDFNTYSIFIVNRSTTDSINLVIESSSLGSLRVVSAQTLAEPDPYATNTAREPNCVTTRDNSTCATCADGVEITLPPVSWSVVVLSPM